MGGTEGRAALALPAVLLDSPSNRVLPATHASAGANLHSYLGPALLKTTDTTGFKYITFYNLSRHKQPQGVQGNLGVLVSKIMVSAANCLLHHHCSLFRNMIHNEKLSYVIFRDSTGYIKIMRVVERWSRWSKKTTFAAQRGGCYNTLIFQTKVGFSRPPDHLSTTHIIFMHISGSHN